MATTITITKEKVLVERSEIIIAGEIVSKCRERLVADIIQDLLIEINGMDCGELKQFRSEQIEVLSMRKAPTS